jgi:RecB family endonuclease NucS
MSPISEEQKSEIIRLIQEGKLTSEKIATKTKVSPETVRAYKAHVTMGTYGPSEVEVEAYETTFSLERDLQKALRSNIEQLEKGLKVTDKGKEQITDAGRIDITAKDKQNNTVVIELKAGEAKPESVTQILAYMGVISKKKQSVRGILVAGEFNDRVVFAANAVPNLQLKKYTFNFSFKSVSV